MYFYVLSLICIFYILYDCVSNVNVLLIQPHGCQNVINVICYVNMIMFEVICCLWIVVQLLDAYSGHSIG